MFFCPQYLGLHYRACYDGTSMNFGHLDHCDHLLDHDVLPGEHQALLVVLQEDHHISLERIPKKRAV